MLLRLLLLLLFLGSCYGDDCPAPINSLDERRLRKKLMCGYDKAIRPVKFFHNQTEVQMQVLPRTIYMMEYSETVALEGNILYSWRDENLIWDVREFGGVDMIKASSDDIWVPDIVITTPTDHSTRTAGIATVDCHVTSEGVVYCFPPVSLQAHCVPDLTLFPYDKHQCNIKFVVFGYVGNHINLELFNPTEGVRMSQFRPNNGWRLLQATAIRNVTTWNSNVKNDFYPDIQLQLVLQRMSGLHEVIFVVPALLLALLSMVTYWMEASDSGRTLICCFATLCEITYLININFQLPFTGDKAPLLATFYRDSMFLTVFALVACVLGRALLARTDPPYPWLEAIVSRLDQPVVGWLLLDWPTKAVEEDTAHIVDSPSAGPKRPWRQCVGLLDRLCFFITFLVYLVLYLFYMP